MACNSVRAETCDLCKICINRNLAGQVNFEGLIDQLRKFDIDRFGVY